MHTYEPRWSDCPEDMVRLDDFRFRDAIDVGRLAEVDRLVMGRTYPEVWHLDEHGDVRCLSRGSSFDSVRRFAADPAAMVECRELVLDEPRPDRWVVVESRHQWMDWYRLDERDAQAFLDLHRGLTSYGITLLDVVVFDQECRWWSLHELTSGTTRWP